jgi:integrase
MMEMMISKWQKNLQKKQKQREQEIAIRDSERALDREKVHRFLQSAHILEVHENLSPEKKLKRADWSKITCVHARDAVMTELAMYNAARQGNICNITLGDWQQKQEVDGELVIRVSAVKNFASYGASNVVIPKEFVPRLTKYISFYRKHSFSAEHARLAEDESIPLFVKPDGTRMPSSSARSATGACFKRAGLAHMTASLVRKGVTSMVHSKKPEMRLDLAQHLGHSPATADRFYGPANNQRRSVKTVRRIIDIMDMDGNTVRRRKKKRSHKKSQKTSRRRRKNRDSSTSDSSSSTSKTSSADSPHNSITTIFCHEGTKFEAN